MRRSQALAVLALAMLLLAALPAQQARAQTAYSEKLNVYIAGNSALWYFTFTGVNGSTALSGLENAPGLTWYNLTAVKTSGWSADYQAFGPAGYGVFPVASPTPEGALLRVGSDSYADALAAASAAGDYLNTEFASSANASGYYAFTAPLTFNTMVPRTLLPLIPSSAGGFARAITPAGLESSTSPFLILQGTKAPSGFDHRLMVGSISGNALDSASRPNILSIYGTTAASLVATTVGAGSSAIQVNVLDGVMKSKDHATVVNDTARFTSTYALSLPAGKKVTVLNATVLQQPAQLIAYRTVSSGVLHTGQKFAVTITLSNLSPNKIVSNINFSDNWWASTGDFTLDHGNFTVPSSVGSSGTVTPVYVLQYTGSGTGEVTIPASVISYTFAVGTSRFLGRTTLNPITVFLGQSEPAIYTYVTPTGGYGKPVGTNQSLKIVAVNVGAQAAASVVLAGRSVGGLAINATTELTISASSQGITGTNVTGSYPISYQDLAGTDLHGATNVFSEVFSHTSMSLGLPLLGVSQSLAQFKGSGTNLTLTFTVTNKGTANVTSFSARGALPRGLPCGAIKGNGTSCSSGVVSLDFTNIGPLKPFTSYMMFNVSRPQNFLLTPVVFTASSRGVPQQGSSNMLGIPAGAQVSKGFVPSLLFGGMTSSVTLAATNSGPFSLYNLTFSSTADSFDALSASALTTKSVPTLAPAGNSSLTYAVKAQSLQGNLTSSGASATFFFGGEQFSQSYPGPKVTIYQPLSAAITTTPSTVTEGKAFTLTVSIVNPSGVAVSNVAFSIPIPSGLSLTGLQGANLVGRNMSIVASSLGPHQTLNATATAQASSGIAVPFNQATLSFSYGGVSIKGTLPRGGIAVGENVLLRYVLPIGLVLLLVLAVVYYVRKISSPSAPASRQ